MQNGVYFTRAAKKLMASQPSDEISEIIPGKLYLGSLKAAKDKQLLQSRNITHILNVSGYPCYFEDDFTYQSHKIDDGCDNIGEFFEPAADFIANSEVVFVHCHGGVSRSSTLVMAHLMINEDMSLYEAKELVKEKRPIVNPHFLFWVQLELLEERLHHEKGQEETEEQSPQSHRNPTRTMSKC